MRKTIFIICNVFAAVFAFGAVPTSNQGAVSFNLRFDKGLSNGAEAATRKFNLFSIKNFCTVSAGQGAAQCYISWNWKKKHVQGFRLLLPRFKADEDYMFLMNWNADNGIYDAYVNGYPVRVPGTILKKCKMPEPGKIKINKGDFQIRNVKLYDHFLNKEEIAKTVPQNKKNPLLSCDLSTPPVVSRGKLIYDGASVDPDFSKWKTEGPVKHFNRNGWSIFESAQPAKRKHIVWWCPKEFPESFIAEWEIKMLSKYGLCIVFFAAKGENGESIFDPSLPERDGTFKQYTSGKIKSYHISYLTNAQHNPGRPQANLRKNNSFFLIAQGSAGMPPDSKVHKITLVKQKSRIFMSVDGRPVIDYTDNKPELYGAPYQGGWIGLRQMSWAKAAYRNFKVWKLKD